MAGMPQDRTEPKDPRKQFCEWCGDKATKAFELPKGKRPNAPGLGMYLYTCPRHHEQAERAGMLHAPYSRRN